MVPFIKMHGLGNDFVVVDDRDGTLSLDHDRRRLLSNRRRGVGCDQLLILEKPTNGSADLFMRIYNPDGSESQACGNGTRCVAALAMDELGADRVTIETIAGNLPTHRAEGGLVTVDMGKPAFGWQDIPVARDMDTLHLDLALPGYEKPVGVNMGNPHCVFFVEDAETVPLAGIGPTVENDNLFPERTNVEFASVRPDGSIRMRVWERGAGITEACGSGACAVAVAAIRRGLVRDGADIDLDGGRLRIDWDGENGVMMTGPTAVSFHGTWQP
ncbi:MAG: diaminopimelate epimerase [Alphaproteobacteria bacterium]